MTARNTGRKDATGRTIWQGPRGGVFVRRNGRRAQPRLTNLPPDMVRVVSSMLEPRNLSSLARTSTYVRDTLDLERNAARHPATLPLADKLEEAGTAVSVLLGDLLAGGMPREGSAVTGTRFVVTDVYKSPRGQNKKVEAEQSWTVGQQTFKTQIVVDHRGARGRVDALVGTSVNGASLVELFGELDPVTGGSLSKRRSAGYRAGMTRYPELTMPALVASRRLEGRHISPVGGATTVTATTVRRSTRARK